MLYDSEKFTLATPRILSPKDRAKKAQLYFDSWFESGNGFYRFFEFGIQDKNYPGAIFQLHQAAEKYLYTILLVYTDYKPKTHELDALMKQASYTDIRFKIVFPNQTEEEKRLFTLLVKAYIDSRYKLGYTVNPDDLKWLAGRVQLLKELTNSICEEKIAEFGKG